MIHDDLFAEFAAAAEQHGWTGIGQPERLLRRYGRAEGDRQVTVSVHATVTGYRLNRVSRRAVHLDGKVDASSYGPRFAGKRGIALSWLQADAGTY